jgi:small subunit ribosomal protein S4
MLQILETRLDNIVYHLGFATTRAAARQMVAHGHVKVNDVIEAKDNNVSKQLATKNMELSTSRTIPEWLSLDKAAFKGTLVRVPTRDEIQPLANEQAVVEFYSR